MGRDLISPAAVTAAAVSEGKDLKTSWPEVVGWVTLNAWYKITRDRPDVSAPFYSETSPLPTDYNPKRVIIIFSNYGQVVVKPPVIG